MSKIRISKRDANFFLLKEVLLDNEYEELSCWRIKALGYCYSASSSITKKKVSWNPHVLKLICEELRDKDLPILAKGEDTADNSYIYPHLIAYDGLVEELKEFAENHIPALGPSRWLRELILSLKSSAEKLIDQEKQNG